jgi:hypothetical protein
MRIRQVILVTTKELEHLLYKHLWRKGWYGVYECAIPKCLCRKVHRERVDMLTYETTGIWRAYELKVSKTDLHSNAALSWIGQYNYLVCTEYLVEEAKKILPKDIGIYAAYEKGNRKWIELVRNPRKRELLCSHEDMQFAMLQALSREYKKYRKLKENEEKTTKKKNSKIKAVNKKN